ncbi:hypothetical protein RchiOBHm_Chr2g0086471 [Rosa chinensis]|uniref:Transmembrane protein n=1 Tax=Rosa chinensis TaxID=74649 RepID=A0A2P6RIE2_ROSCH|nr:hypothetical protein RchiOBHm_Chr2g0086471 [Rosa chinensis]
MTDDDPVRFQIGEGSIEGDEREKRERERLERERVVMTLPPSFCCSLFAIFSIPSLPIFGSSSLSLPHFVSKTKVNGQLMCGSLFFLCILHAKPPRKLTNPALIFFFFCFFLMKFFSPSDSLDSDDKPSVEP